MRRVARIETQCPTCAVSFTSLACQKRRYCSNRCARIGNWKDADYAARVAASHVGKPGFRGQHTAASVDRMRAAHFNGQQRVVRKNGYAYVYCPDHPRAINGRIPEHVAVMEAHIGRPMRPDEVAHHINEVKLDNRIENLQLMSAREHRRLHARERGLGTLIQPTASARRSAA